MLIVMMIGDQYQDHEHDHDHDVMGMGMLILVMMTVPNRKAFNMEPPTCWAPELMTLQGSPKQHFSAYRPSEKCAEPCRTGQPHAGS